MYMPYYYIQLQNFYTGFHFSKILILIKIWRKKINVYGGESYFQFCEEVAFNELFFFVNQDFLKYRLGFIKYMPVPDKPAN